MGSQRGMRMSNRSLAVVAIVVGVVAPAWGQVGRPNTFTFPPGPITQPPPTANHPLNNPHPMQPWDPLWTTHFSYGGYGALVQYIPVPPQQVAIQVPVPPPESAPAQAQERTGVPAQTREEPSAPAQTQEQTVEIPGYYVAETTTGYWYPERWTLQEVSPGVYQWVKLPAEFRPK